ncbi:histidine phosphatase family protein [Oceanispirochaeta sp. M2]|uniref:histidine phosphatase family protein n=2 Tax=Oceanispirochaeta TaxID=2035349 RepID=UPI000E09AFD4|nr:histidine phosphatase family protein [Oceanispirochaeta sp. M1]MBF9014968.1 histidine phosphatase family protein [Oceanispirochaeta sp. M2]NPD71351.1 histidine phosphatase family protein [Oceanispirochaeta sp. M1]RDG33434.1 histidine phosphatase family protein [Oceanispirochaeta sp. M1]
MSELYLIRHAQSKANSQRIMASRQAFPLTDAGKADADLIASQLYETIQIDRIISSPLNRAMQTAASFADLYNLEIEVDERISEQELGKYSGMTYDQVKKEEQYETVTSRRWDWVPEGGGESYRMIADRVRSFFDSFSMDAPDKILIVTHAVTFRLIRAVLENTLPEYPESFPNNGEIWKVDFKGIGQHHSIESLLLGNSRDFAHNP